MLPSLLARIKGLFPRTFQRWRFLFLNDHRDLMGFNVSDVFQSIAFMILIGPQIVLFESATSVASNSFVIFRYD